MVHLAACTTDAPWAEQVTLSVEGSISLFEAARAAGVMRVIYASSHHVVGYHPRTTVLDEHAVLKPDSRYGVSKVFGEARNTVTILGRDGSEAEVPEVSKGDVADVVWDRVMALRTAR